MSGALVHSPTHDQVGVPPRPRMPGALSCDPRGALQAVAYAEAAKERDAHVRAATARAPIHGDAAVAAAPGASVAGMQNAVHDGQGDDDAEDHGSLRSVMIRAASWPGRTLRLPGENLGGSMASGAAWPSAARRRVPAGRARSIPGGTPRRGAGRDGAPPGSAA